MTKIKSEARSVTFCTRMFPPKIDLHWFSLPQADRRAPRRASPALCPRERHPPLPSPSDRGTDRTLVTPYPLGGGARPCPSPLQSGTSATCATALLRARNSDVPVASAPGAPRSGQGVRDRRPSPPSSPLNKHRRRVARRGRRGRGRHCSAAATRVAAERGTPSSPLPAATPEGDPTLLRPHRRWRRGATTTEGCFRATSGPSSRCAPAPLPSPPAKTANNVAR